MRVLHLIPRMNYFGGTARKLHILLRDKGFGCLHLCAVGKNDGIDWLEGVEIISLNGNDRFGPEVKRVCEIIEERQIDLLVGHFFHMSLVAYIAANRSKIPFVCQEHGIVVGENLVKYPLRTWILSKARLIVANSYATAKALKKKYPFTHNKIRVIYNGIEHPVQNSQLPIRDSLGIPANGLLVGTIGRYLQLRKHGMLVTAFVDVCTRIKDAHLVCLGEGGSEYERVRDIAKRLAPDNIHFLPRSPYVGNFLRDIDIYVNVATAEGFGIATCEAMLMEKAVIAAQAGALPEYCFHEQNSILVPPNNAAALAHAMDRLLRDEELRKTLGANARIDVSKRFTTERYLRENNAVCYEAMGRTAL